jgi:hypothetical protein
MNGPGPKNHEFAPRPETGVTPNNKGATGNVGPNEHTRQIRRHTTAPAVHEAPPNEPAPDNTPARRRHVTTPSEMGPARVPPSDNVPPENMRAHHEHAPPPPTSGQGEVRGNGEGRHIEKPARPENPEKKKKSPPPE